MIEYRHQRDYDSPICPIPYGGSPTNYTLVALKDGSYTGHISWLSGTTGGIVSVFPKDLTQLLVEAGAQYAANHPGMSPPVELPMSIAETVIHPPGGLNVG